MAPPAEAPPASPAAPDTVPVPVAALVAEGAALLAAAEVLFAGCERHILSHDELRPRTPFSGRLFAVVAALPPGVCVGLVVPVVRLSPASAAETAGAEAAARPDALLLAVADHVGLEPRGPLSGRWPPGVPRTFPSVTGIYQPAVVRARGGARVYSSGVVVAGVTDAGRLTPFEARAAAAAGCSMVSDTLVPAAVIAAYHGLKLAACGFPQGPAND